MKLRIIACARYGKYSMSEIVKRSK
jgi:hypothetical protein